MVSSSDFERADIDRCVHGIYGSRLAVNATKTRMGARLASAITYPLLAAPPGSFGVVSSDANDIAGGTGARTVAIDYWANLLPDPGFRWRRLTGIPLNGTSFVNLSGLAPEKQITDFYRLQNSVINKINSCMIPDPFGAG